MRSALLPGLALVCVVALAALIVFLSTPAGSGARDGSTPAAEAPVARARPAVQEAIPGAAAGETGGGQRQAAEAPQPPPEPTGKLLAGELAAAQTLRGSVRTLGGPNLAGANLELADSSGKVVARTTTSDAGEFTLYLARPVQAGRLEVVAPGHVPFSLTGLRVAEGAQMKIGQLHLDRAAPMEGRVLDASGEPLGGVRAILHVIARGSRLDLSASSGPDGVFRIPGAPATGRHVLELIPASGTPQRFPVTLPGPGVHEFRL